MEVIVFLLIVVAALLLCILLIASHLHQLKRRGLVSAVDRLRRIVVGVAIILSAVTIIVVIVWETCKPGVSVMVDPIQVLPHLAKQGYTSRVSAQHLVAMIHEINQHTSSKAKMVLTTNLVEPDFVLSTTTLSISSVALHLRLYLGHFVPLPTYVVSGDFLRTEEGLFPDGDFSLNLRINGKVLSEVPGDNQGTTIDQLLEVGARKIIWAIEPYRLAEYYFSKDNLPMVKELLPFLFAKYVNTEDEVRLVSIQGILLFKDGKYKEGMDKFEKAIQLDPRFIRIYTNYGIALAELRRFADAIDKFEEAIKYDPKNARVHYSWGTALVEQGLFDEAVKKFEETIKYDPKFALAYFGWGTALGRQGHFDDAIQKFEKAIERDPESAWAYVGWGDALGRQGLFDEAIERFEEAIKYDPKFVLAYVGWGNALGRQGLFDEAIERFEEAIKYDPKFVLAYFGWGNALGRQGLFDEAIEKFEKAVELDPQFDWAYYGWAGVLTDKGECGSAIDKYTKAFKLNPTLNRPDLGAMCLKYE